MNQIADIILECVTIVDSSKHTKFSIENYQLPVLAKKLYDILLLQTEYISSEKYLALMQKFSIEELHQILHNQHPIIKKISKN